MNPAENKECIILFYGDSITDGNRYKLKEQEWDLNHQIGHSYAYIINAFLGSEYPEKNYKFINKGISGNRIIDLYARVDQDVIAHCPDIISILIGINDGPSEFNFDKATDSQKFENIYRMMMDEILAQLPEVKFIICEPFVCNAGSLRVSFTKWRSGIVELQRKVADIAKEYKAIFVPLQDAFDKACEVKCAEYWCWDGIHPTENGNGLIAREWLKAVNELLWISKGN